jgi:hypothetical protein
VVQLDSFAGADDDTKLDNALAYAAAQPHIPAVQFPAREVTLTKSRTPFSGMKLIGPDGTGGPKNLELLSGKYVNHQVNVNVGTGTSSWFYGTGTYYDIYISGLAMRSVTKGQFWHQPSGHLFACKFDSLTFYQFTYVFGQPSAKAMMWQVIFSGHWTVNGFQDTPFTIGGSDCAFWRDGYINLQGPSTQTSSTYQMILDGLQKTSIGYMYITCGAAWRGLNIKDWTSSITIFGGSFEGYHASTSCNGSVIKVDNGMVDIRSPWVAYGMVSPDPGESGIIQVNGGNVVIDRPTYDRGNTALSVPLMYVTGGKAVIRDAVVLGSTVQIPVVSSSGGTLLHDSSVSEV